MQRPLLSVVLAASALFLSCDDGITDADRVAIAFSTSADTLFKSASLQLTPTVTNDGAVISRPVTWSSSDTLVAKVSSAGLVTGVGRGSAIVTASSGAARALKTIVVDSLVEVRPTPLNPALYAGDSVQLTAIGIGVLRNAAISEVTWATEDSRVASVSTNGMVIGRGPGITRIIVARHNATATVSFGVLPVSADRHLACAGRGTIHRGSERSATWRAEDGPHFLYGAVSVTRLTVEPGATICGLPGSSLLVSEPIGAAGALLEARGTAQQPIRLVAADTAQGWLGIDGRSGNASFTLAHTVIENASRGVAGWGGVLTILDSRLSGTFVEYCGVVTTVDVRRTVFDRSAVCISDGTFEDNVIRHAGLTVFPDRASSGLARVVGCRITDGPADGISVVAGAAAEIHECNLERNVGFGVRNYGTLMVDAKRNWWGDPAGPTGPSGDGVFGNVDTSEPLAAPRP